MLRFPIIHKGWVPKNTCNYMLHIFWENKSDMFYEYEKTDVEIAMELGTIPFENLEGKSWSYIKDKLREIERIEEYRKREKVAYIIPLR